MAIGTEYRLICERDSHIPKRNGTGNEREGRVRFPALAPRETAILGTAS